MSTSRPSTRRVQPRRPPPPPEGWLERLVARFMAPIDALTTSMLYADVLEHLRDSQPQPVGFQREDFVEALGTALVAIVATMPSLLPLWLLRDDPLAALRISNIVSFIMLFVLGYRWGRYTGANPRKIGWLLVLAGVLLMAIAIPLGG